ncbi:hypothetical protein [Streptomyces gilvifuscus]|uniref:hypothetical protein n=1 Tax=Streptomyces gilvifuscus TaxID=1550617 RepID=UPI002FEE523D
MSRNLTPAGCLFGVVFGRHVDAGGSEAYTVGVVTALRDQGTDEAGKGEAGDAKPVRPRKPVTVVAGDGLADFGDDGLNGL